MPKLVTGDYGATVPLTRPRKPVGSGLGFSMPTVTPSPITAPALTGPIGIGGGGGGTTTRTVTPTQVYQDQILGDPEAAAAQGVFSTQASDLANARAAAIQRAVINAGWTPDLSGGLGGYASDLTPSALAQAAANPMSQKAQLDLQLSQARGNTPYDLAARGGGRSGALPIALGNLSQQYDTASYQGIQGLLDQIYGAANTYAGGYNTALSSLSAARAAVADRLARQAGYSESIVSSDGGGGDGGGDGGGWDVPGYGVPPGETSYGSFAGSPAGQASTEQAVSRVIAAMNPSQPNLNQVIRNVRMG